MLYFSTPFEIFEIGQSPRPRRPLGASAQVGSKTARALGILGPNYALWGRRGEKRWSRWRHGRLGARGKRGGARAASQRRR